MIVGHGSIASMLNDREGVLFFAAGVSDSSCTDTQEYLREWHLLWNTIRQDMMVVYFSTISTFQKATAYTGHKIAVEVYIRKYIENYTIIRLGNIYGDTNKHTFQNAIKAKREAGEPVEIRDEWKYMISKEQLLFVTDNLPLKGKHEISIFGEMKKVRDLI